MPEPAPSLAARVQVRVICPLCLWSHVLEKSGADARLRGQDTPAVKGPFRFDRADPAAVLFVDYRDASGGRHPDGRGAGFPRVGGLTLAQACEHPAYRELLRQARDQAARFVEACRDLPL